MNLLSEIRGSHISVKHARPKIFGRITSVRSVRWCLFVLLTKNTNSTRLHLRMLCLSGSKPSQKLLVTSFSAFLFYKLTLPPLSRMLSHLYAFKHHSSEIHNLRHIQVTQMIFTVNPVHLHWLCPDNTFRAYW